MKLKLKPKKKKLSIPTPEVFGDDIDFDVWLPCQWGNDTDGLFGEPPAMVDAVYITAFDGDETILVGRATIHEIVKVAVELNVFFSTGLFGEKKMIKRMRDLAKYLRLSADYIEKHIPGKFK